jgi:competence protein ComGC
MNCPKAMVWVWLVHQTWKTGKNTVVVPNRALVRYGVSRDVKSSALRQLEAAGWITVKRSACKNPIVTVVLANADGTVGD